MIDINHKNIKQYSILFIFIIAILIIPPITLNHFLHFSFNDWITFWSDYLGAVIGVISSVIIALYETNRQIRANKIDNLKNAITINNYKKLDKVLNGFFTENNKILKLRSDIQSLIKYSKSMKIGIGKEQFIRKSLKKYYKTIQEMILFYDSYISKIKSITGMYLHLSKAIKDLEIFSESIKYQNSNNTLYAITTKVLKINSQLIRIYYMNDTNNSYNAVTDGHYPIENTSNLVKTEINYLSSLNSNATTTNSKLVQVLNDIQLSRDAHIKKLENIK